MSIFEDEILNSSTKHIPDLQLAQSIFLLENGFGEDEEGLKASILGSIEEDKMAPLYGELCERLGWEKDEGLEARLRYGDAVFLLAFLSFSFSFSILFEPFSTAKRTRRNSIDLRRRRDLRRRMREIWR